jgi:hypothetical protein
MDLSFFFRWYKIENSAVIDSPERILTDIVSKYINFESLFQNRGTWLAHDLSFSINY